MKTVLKHTPPNQYNVAQSLFGKKNEKITDFISWKFKMPRQIEIHIPPYLDPYGSNPKPDSNPCIFKCSVCAGKHSGRGLRYGWEKKALGLLSSLKGTVPFTILSGHYTEPMSSPYFFDFLKTTKENGGYFGVHTNGARLVEFEEKFSGLTKALQLPGITSEDFISVSVYGGSPESFYTHTGTSPNTNYFESVLDGIALLGKLKRQLKSPMSFRISYLGTAVNLHKDQLQKIVSLARKAHVDSLRFSIAFAPYNMDFNKVKSVDDWRIKKEAEILPWLQPYVSFNKSQKPYIFYRPEALTDVGLYDKITNCFYGYLQVTISARGTWTKCSTVTMSMEHDLGEVTNSVIDFKKIVKKYQNPEFNACTGCFKKGLRCDPLATTFNNALSNRTF